MCFNPINKYVVDLTYGIALLRGVAVFLLYELIVVVLCAKVWVYVDLEPLYNGF